MVRYQSHVNGITAEGFDGFFEGWPAAPTSQSLVDILSRSDHVVVALERDAVVGFANALSDGVLSAYIPLVEVRREHRGRGIGAGLVRVLLEQLSDVYMVDVVCDEDVTPFYERLGFERVTGMARRNRGAPVLEPR